MDYSESVDESAIILNGYNTERGHVARFTHIDPGEDKEFRVVLDEPRTEGASNPYMNAMMLQAFAPSTVIRGPAFPGKRFLLSDYQVIDIATADFNHDGLDDIVSANSGEGSLSILLGLGHSEFKEYVSYSIGSRIFSALTGDLNSDGNIDIVSVNLNLDNISVFLGLGDGSFERAGTYLTGRLPLVGNISDLDGDGIMDVVTASDPQGAREVSILYGIGDGSFMERIKYRGGRNPVSIGIEDLNNDGNKDIVVLNFLSHNLSIILGKGNRSFEPQESIGLGSTTRVSSMVISYITDDHFPDLLIGQGPPHSSVVLYKGRGDGTFKKKKRYKVGSTEFSAPGALNLGDVDLDGKIDIGLIDFGFDEIKVLIGQGGEDFKISEGFM